VLTTGGLGKSTLASKVYTEMKEMTVFTDAKYVTFDLDEQSNDNAVIGEVQRWLESQTGPFLLVLDNVQRQYQRDRILDHPNIIAKSFVLVTSRRRDLIASSDQYDMPIMEDSDALELFRWHSQGVNSSGELKNRSLKV
jgi:cellulose biosynthesis protein BcsQ